jgi:metal-responsive CopG/Arc/MetJ family transcriptional regulator
VLHAVILSYTRAVKTAISVPEDVFDAVARQAQQLGVSRSEFFATAARRYLDELNSSSITAEIDHALTLTPEDESVDVAVAAGRRRVADETGW